MITRGQLAAGERVPSSRQLAAELGISRGLVLECYAQLRAEGFLSAQAGSATRVAAAAGAPRTARRPPPSTRRMSADFRSGVPDLTSFPRRDWAWALAESCRTVTAPELDYGDPRGAIALREVLASYLRRVRHAQAAAERIVVCSGFAQAVNLMLQVLARTGVRCVAIEDPGDDDYRQISARLGLQIVTAPVDEGGIDVAALADTPARAVILTPTHQFPTGVEISAARRRALAAWAIERDATIIEDDYDAEFRYDREPVGALQGAAPEHVALIGTVSKSLAPALRLGWVLCPEPLLPALTEEKGLMDRGAAVLDQLALAALITSGRYDRHLRRMRAVYAGRRDALVAALAEHAPEVVLQGLAAGLHAVARLPARCDEPAIVAAARARGVGLYGMSGFRAGGAPAPPELVLGFGNLGEAAIAQGIAAIGDLLRG